MAPHYQRTKFVVLKHLVVLQDLTPDHVRIFPQPWTPGLPEQVSIFLISEPQAPTVFSPRCLLPSLLSLKFPLNGQMGDKQDVL